MADPITCPHCGELDPDPDDVGHVCGGKVEAALRELHASGDLESLEISPDGTYTAKLAPKHRRAMPQ